MGDARQLLQILIDNGKTCSIADFRGCSIAIDVSSKYIISRFILCNGVVLTMLFVLQAGYTKHCCPTSKMLLI